MFAWMQSWRILFARLMNGFDWQDYRKGATLPQSAGEFDLAPQQPRQLADDGKSESRPSGFPHVLCINLVESLEDALLKVFGDANPGIFDGKGKMACIRSHRRFCYLALLSELEGIGDQIQQDLAQFYKI